MAHVSRVVWDSVTEAARDISHAGRGLFRQPGFLIAALVTLALCIGANTAIFSIVNAVYLRPLPFPESDRLFVVARTGNRIGGSAVSLPIYLAWKKQPELFDSLALASWSGGMTMGGGNGDPERVSGMSVTPDLFAMLGVRPLAGRLFDASDAKPDAANVVILSDSVWRMQFGADPAIANRRIQLGGEAYTVVGVLAPDLETSFPGARGTQVWLPLKVPATSQNPSNFALCAGRLRKGVTATQAETILTRPLAELSAAFPTMIGPAEKARLVRLRDVFRNRAGSPPLLLLGAVGLVLLIGCANVANLLLARMRTRRGELAVRAALGATPSRLARLLLAESFVLALGGGLIGLATCYVSMDLILAIVPQAMPRVGRISIDGSVLLFAFLLSILTGLVFGVAPALRASRVDLQSAMKESGGRSGASRGRLRVTLVMGEVAIALVLLVGSALLFQSFLRITDVSPGLDPRNVLTFGVTAPSSAGGRVQPAVLFHDFARQLSALPGAEEVAYANVLPLEGTGGDYLFSVEGRTGDAQEGYDADVRKISPGYFSALRIPLLHGRAFTDADSTDGAEPVVVINDAVAQMVWHGADPVGEHIWVGKPMGPAAAEAAPRRVVGVVGSVREDSLAEGVSAVIYFPFARSDRNSTAVVFAVRSSQDPRSLIPEVRRTLRQMNSSAPLGAIRTMEEIIAASVTGRRFQTILLGLFGGMAVLIAIVGVYGVISYSVAQRTREVGIRMSLGAARGDVLRLILAQGLRLGAGGIAIGIVASLALTRLLQNLLYGITATDLATFLAVSVGLFAAILCACWVPARRATRVDPIVALRYE